MCGAFLVSLCASDSCIYSHLLPQKIGHISMLLKKIINKCPLGNFWLLADRTNRRAYAINASVVYVHNVLWLNGASWSKSY